jgi:hypothetical protein
MKEWIKRNYTALWIVFAFLFFEFLNTEKILNVYYEIGCLKAENLMLKNQIKLIEGIIYK